MTSQTRPTASGNGAENPSRPNLTGAALDEPGSQIPGSPADHPRLRRFVYFCAAIGMALAVLFLLRSFLQVNSPLGTALCGPCCR